MVEYISNFAETKRSFTMTSRRSLSVKTLATLLFMKLGGGIFVLCCDAAVPQQRIMLVDFSDYAVATGCVSSVVEAGGTVKLYPRSDCLNLVFDKVVKTRISVPSFFGSIGAMLPENNGIEFYLKYRARKLDGKFMIRFPSVSIHAATGLTAIKTSAKEEISRFRPELIVAPDDSQLDGRKVTDIGFTVKDGSGDIDLIEFGVVDKGPLPSPHDFGLPHVDSEAFAIFPEPRIFHDTGHVVPFASFGSRFSLSGDIPPGPVDYFVHEMKSFYGIDFTESKDAKIEFAVAEKYPIDSFCKIKFDGFAIDIATNHIRVAAKDPKGLVFGIHVLVDMIKMASGDIGTPKARLCTVVDWPRTDKRFFIDVFSGWEVVRYEPDMFLAMCERFPISARFNMFSIELKRMYRWESTPEVVLPDAWTKADLEKVVDFFNANAFTFFPRKACLGHMGAMLATKMLAAKYGEDGDRSTLCTGNPEALKMLFSSLDEIHSICSRNPKYAPKYFYAGMDECRWKKTLEKPPEKRCPRCKGIPKNRIFLEQARRVDEWCRKKGLKMVMPADMVRAYHNGIGRWKCYEVEGEIPKDVIYLNWSPWDFMEIEETAAAGHENWKQGYSDDPEGDASASAYGIATFDLNWWLVANQRGGRKVGGAFYGPMAQRILADYSWRRAPSGSMHDGHSLVSRWGDFILRNWSRKPIPHGAATFTPIDISKVATLALSAEFDTSLKSLSGVPVHMVVQGQKTLAAEAVPDGVNIFVGRKAASLALLHAVAVPGEFYSYMNRSGDTAGEPVAEYMVKYADETYEKITVRYGWHATDYRSGPTIGRVFARYPAGCRAVLTGRLPAGYDDVASDTGIATMYEWVNPHPEKEIKSLLLLRKNRLARYAALAITARDVK